MIKNVTNVRFAIRALFTQVTLKFIIELTLENDHTNVRFAIRTLII